MIVRWDPDLTAASIVFSDGVVWSVEHVGDIASVGMGIDRRPVDLMLAMSRGEVSVATWDELVGAVPELKAVLPAPEAFVQAVKGSA